MLYGKIVRSTVSHGRIRSIDVEAARALAGVHRVVTIADIRTVVPQPFYGPAFHDQPILALDKVHYVGEPVAVVLAADPHIAEAAAQLVVADYEELPAVYDEVEAMTSAAIVHDVLKPAGTFPDLKHLQGRREHQCGARFPSAARRRRGAASRRPITCSSTPSAPSRCCICRSSRSCRSARARPTTDGSPSTPPRSRRPSCASRSRGCSAGRRTACA